MANVFKFNPIEGTFDIVLDTSLITLKGVVDTTGDLPLSGNSENDTYIVKADDRMYTWNKADHEGILSDWVDIGSVSSIDWSIITNKPTSIVGDIDDAVTKKHDKLHEINNTLNHLGISGSGIEDNFMAIDTNGLPKDSGKTAIDFANAIHNHVELDITDLNHYDSEDFADDFGLADLANLGTKSYNDLTDKPDLSDLHFHDNKVELDLVTDGNHDVRVDNPHIVTVDQLDLASGTVASDIDDAITKKHDHSNKALLDTYTQTETNIADAVSKKHVQNEDVALRTDKLTVDVDGNTTIAGELKIKVYSQDTEPDLGDQKLAIWIDTDDSDRVYLLFRRGSGDQVAVELA